MSLLSFVTTSACRRPASLGRIALHTAFCLGLWIGVRPLSAQEEVVIPLGASAQAIVNAHPPGTRYRLAAGIHRGQLIEPKDGDIITGQPGAVLNGCLLLENWQREGDWWVHPVPVLVPLVSGIGKACADDLCLQPQDFYLDGVRFQAMATLDLATGPRTWFLDRDQGKVYLSTDPTGLPAELGGGSTSAIDCAPPGRPLAVGVIIEDLTIEKYPCPPQIGAVRLGGGGTIRRCVVTSSHSYGIQLMTSAAVVQKCYLGDHGMSAIGGTGIGAVVEDCELAYNVWPMYASLAWDNGGSKVAGCRDFVFRRNYIHHNHGPGLWTDIKTTQTVIEDNIVEFNEWEGILVEISDQVVVRRNICRWNGVVHRGGLWGAQICVQNSKAVEIHSNFLETGPDYSSPWGSQQGIIAINQNERSFDEERYEGSFGVREIKVHHNLLLMPSGGRNGFDYGTLGWATYEDFLAAGLEWRDNTYLIGQPLDHGWGWRRQPNWDTYGALGLRWEDWQTDQDARSTLSTIGAGQFPPAGSAQLDLIRTVTGNNYAELKAQASALRPVPSTVDRDGDALPDEWERRFSPSLALLDGAGDTDGDGWTNSEELARGTHPQRRDTDEDGLPDSWEPSRGLNPLVHDSTTDADSDGRNAFEEWMDGTDLAVPNSLAGPVDESAVGVWLTPSSHLATEADGTVVSWKTNGLQRLPVGWLGTPKVDAASPSGMPLVNKDITIVVPGRPSIWGTEASGSTLTFLYQPLEIDLSREWRAVLTNEVYNESGFRLRLESGYLVLSAGQSGGSLHMAGHTRLKAGQTYLITLSVEPDGKGGSLYLDGQLEASSASGTVVPGKAGMMLGNIGGITPQPARFGEVVVFNRRLTHLERRTLEGFLNQKYFTGLPEGPDADRDGMPKDWELAHGLDPVTPNAQSDEDSDGAANGIEFQQGLDPTIPDTDLDGLPDGWEVTWGTNPLVNDAAADPDEDDLSNLEEFENKSDPKSPDFEPAAMDFNRLRLWWRADQGLERTSASLTRWLNSAPGTNPGLPQDPANPPLIAPEPWATRPVVRLSDVPIVSTTAVSLGSQLHPAGLTLTAAVRPAGASGPGFRQLLRIGGIFIGTEGTRLVLRNESGSIQGLSTVPVPSEPFVLGFILPAAPKAARLRINGSVVAEVTGLTPPESGSLSLGGPGAWSGDIAEVAVHAGVLTPLQQLLFDRLLTGKWLGTGPLAADTDQDGLPDWWEQEACTNPVANDASADSDWNGESNLAAYQAGRPGFVWQDADLDSMHDGWERVMGLNPTVNDADEDPDHDGMTNAIEHALLSPPLVVDTPDAWGIAPASDVIPSSIRLTLRSSHRSWSRRLRWESRTSLDPNAWTRLPPGRIIDPASSAWTLEENVLTTDSAGEMARSFFRLRLQNE